MSMREDRQIRDSNLLDDEEFGATVESQIEDLDAIDVLGRMGLALTVRVGTTDLKVNLAKFYAAYRQYPDQIDAIIAVAIESLQHLKASRSPRTFAELRDRLLPMLKPITLLNTMYEGDMPMPVYRPFLADLIITYVIKEPESVAFVNEEHLTVWGIGEHELHEQALANLRRRTLETSEYTVTGSGDQRLFIFNTQDGFDAARLLIPEILDRWRAQLPGSIVIAVPNRDFLIAFSDIDRTVLANMARQIQLDSVQHEHGLTDQLFTLSNGEVRAYEWD